MAAISGEDYEAAATLRDEALSLRMDTEVAVLAANAEFYRAFSQRDASAMEAIWLDAPHIACLHPGHPPLFGREDVMDSWHEIFESEEDEMEIAAGQVRCRVSGIVARVSCLEMLQPGDGSLAATNIFERHGGRWRIVLHHAGPLMV